MTIDEVFETYVCRSTTQLRLHAVLVPDMTGDAHIRSNNNHNSGSNKQLDKQRQQ